MRKLGSVKLKSRGFRRCVVLLLISLTTATGCHPTQPFYLYEDGDLSHLIDTATDIEYPDVHTASLKDASLASAPLTLSNPDFEEVWDLSLEECISITLNNSQVIRNLGGVTQRGFADALVGSTAGAATVYDAAIAESAVGVRSDQLMRSLEGRDVASQVGGVASALSQFDAQFEVLSALGGGDGSLLTKRDRAQNVSNNIVAGQIFPQVLQQDTSNVTTQLRKRTATGGTWIIRGVTSYDRGNSRAGSQALNSFWTQAIEMEVIHPLLRGRGTQINRIPVLLARMTTDITLANFEGSVRNLVMDVENTYWDLHCAYRNLETAKVGRDSAQATWKIIYEKKEGGKETAQAEAQAREQYFFFRSALETALRDLYDLEGRLRFLMGIASADNRLVRPTDEPTMAEVTFTWQEVQAEALLRSPEIRQQKWAIKQRELELISAKNQLLPRFDVRAIYRWLGSGDHLINADRNGINFPNPGSTAFDELTEGNYQEFSVGVDFQPPRFGARRELAGVRNSQLALARNKAQLKDIELNTIHLLSTSVRNLDFFYQVAKSHFNRWKAAETEVEVHEALRKGGIVTVDLVLRAQERRARAQADFYRALCDYNKAIADVHFRKGSLLEHNGIHLAEGPWPKKAYWDALGHARERDASHYLDYGWTRPRVISRGPVPQHMHGKDGAAPQGEPRIEAESLPSVAPDPSGDGPAEEPRHLDDDLPEPNPVTLDVPARPLPGATEVGAGLAVDQFEWGEMGFQRREPEQDNPLRQASYDEE